MTRLVAAECGCFTDYYSGPRPKECDCGNRLQTPAQLAPPKERTPLRRVSLKRQEEIDAGSPLRKRSTLKRGRGLSASPVQQRKVMDLSCINCGRDRFEVTITAMHVYPRRFASCDCADGVVPGCVECHDFYDDQLDPKKKLDLLPLLVAHGYRRELVHPVLVHEASILHVLEVVCGEAYVPGSKIDQLRARIVELEGAIAA